DELLEPPVERRPGALALHVRTPRRAELVAPREDRGEGCRKTAAVVCRAADRAGDATARDLVVCRHEARRPYLPGLEEAGAEAFARDVLVPEAGMDEVTRLRREEAERAWQLEQRGIRNEAKRLLVVRGRDESGAVRDERQARRRRLVDVCVKEDRLVALALPA